MKTAAVRPAHIRWDADHTPHGADFDGSGLSPDAALALARSVHLAGNDLPARWRGREHFTVLATGFGLGHGFIATWAAWQQDAARSGWLHVVAVECHPPTRGDLARAHAASPHPALAQALVSAWPELTPNLHALSFEQGRVRLLLAFGNIDQLLPELRCRADAFYLDGLVQAQPNATTTTAATAATPLMRLMRALARRAAPGATATSHLVAPALSQGLTAAGFAVHQAQRDGGDAFTCARWQPRYVPCHQPMPAPRAAADAVVVGAGLAGAFVARSLHERGWQVLVLDGHAQPAQEASGNPAGVFHGTVHPQDGSHARLLRSAALHAQRRLHPWLVARQVPGQADGLLQTQRGDIAAMHAVLAAQGLPAGYVQALDRAEASRRAGVPLPGPAWFYPGGGWLSPRALVAQVLDGRPGLSGAPGLPARPGLSGLSFSGGCAVAGLRAVGERWQVLDSAGAVLAESAVVVLANAAQAAQLLAPWGAAGWALRRARGQLSGWHGSPTGLALPLAGDGYALPLSQALGGGVWCGATSEVDDDDAAQRPADHRFNLERLARLTGLAPPAGAAVIGRVAWRVQADDRLPVAGPLPARAGGGRGDQARMLARTPGLFVCTALGGRGITWAPLLGDLLAAQVAGTPLPLEQSLLDALDPGRWQVRAVRRA